jgi:hypothetical protein
MAFKKDGKITSKNIILLFLLFLRMLSESFASAKDRFYVMRRIC